MKERTLVFTTNDVQKRLYEILKKKDSSVASADWLTKDNASDLKNFNTIILPFPTRKDKLSFIADDASLSELVSENQQVIGGLLDEEIINEIKGSGGEHVDYFNNEAYVLKNAYITSQGALRLLLETTTDFIVGKKVLITGFGRIGKSLSVMLKSLGMKVFIAARSEVARAEASAMGLDVFTFSQMKGTLFYYDFIFNTVPSIILDSKDIKHIRYDAFYIELASYPYGADERNFAENSRAFINGNALPGRYFPSAVAENMSDFILSLRR